MGLWNFKNIRLVIAEPVEDIRFGLRDALSVAGFEQIKDTGRIAAVRDSIVNNRVDLLVCDTHLSDGDSDDLIHQVRHHQVGNNPFVAIITLTPTADEQMIKKIINSGTDDILVMPISPGLLIERVVHLTQERKPFVVTTDYIGPNRRQEHRPGTQEIPLNDVPNPLKAIADGETDACNLQAEINAAAAVLNEQKIERHAYQIVYLVEKIVQIDTDVPGDESVLSHLERLASVSDDISRRIEGSVYAHWSGLCRSLADVVGRVREAQMNPNENDVAELRNLAEDFQIEICREERAVQFG